LLRIYLTGSAAIEADQIAVSEWRTVGRQGRLVFAMLAAEHPNAVTRDQLIGELWPVDPPPSGDRALTAIISKLRAMIEGSGPSAIGISSSFGSYQLRLPADCWIDLRTAAESIDKADGALRNGDFKAAWPLAQIACHIARRPFLQGDEGPWVLRTRRELQTILLRAHECLAGIYISSGEYATAAVHGNLAVQLEPYRETAHLLLMRAHAAAGNRAEALRTYEHCRLLLSEDLGVSPSIQVEAEYLAILRSS